MNSAARHRDSERSFAGPEVRCTRWRDDYDLNGQHAAVVGSGAAIARVLPGVAAQARRVTVFQHDPIWVLPAPPLPGVRLLRRLPRDLLGLLPARTSQPLPGETTESPNFALLQRLTGEVLRLAAVVNLRVQVRDSWQRRQLTPDSTTGVRLHNHYYPALQRQNCTLITWPIARLAPLGIRTVDGQEHRVDCIIYAEDAP